MRRRRLRDSTYILVFNTHKNGFPGAIPFIMFLKFGTLEPNKILFYYFALKFFEFVYVFLFKIKYIENLFEI